MKSKSLLATMAVIFMAAGGISWADEHLEVVEDIDQGETEVMRKELAKRFTELDTNTDGVIDRDEAQSHPKVAEQFNALDEDDSGDLSQEEFEQCKGCAKFSQPDE